MSSEELWLRFQALYPKAICSNGLCALDWSWGEVSNHREISFYVDESRSISIHKWKGGASCVHPFLPVSACGYRSKLMGFEEAIKFIVSSGEFQEKRSKLENRILAAAEDALCLQQQLEELVENYHQLLKNLI